MKLFNAGALALCVIALVACAAPTPPATPVPPTPTLAPSADPASLIKALVDALNNGNVDAAMAFYADDVIRTQQPPPSGQTGVWTGKEQVRSVVKGMIADHFNVELSNLKAVGDKVTYTCTFYMDTYRNMGVAPLVVNEEAVFEKGKIKSQAVTITPESLAKIQAAMAAAQAKSALPKKVLLIAQERADDMEFRLTKEVGVIVSLLEKAGLKVVVATVSGQPLVGSATTLKPDLKLADVKVEDYAGFIVPCMGSPASNLGPDAVEIVKKAAALGKPIAAQLRGIGLLSQAGLLKGKQFAMLAGFENLIPEGIYKGEGVVQDGNSITSGICPREAGLKPDGTSELTKKLIEAVASIH